MANTTQDSAGMPWNKVRIGERKLSIAFERAMIRPSSPPMMNAPPRPARIRSTVDNTSHNIAPLEKISMQRQNTSISDGNRKRGKNSDANCQSAITTRKGNTEVQIAFAVAKTVLDQGEMGACYVMSVILQPPHKLLRVMGPTAGTKSPSR